MSGASAALFVGREVGSAGGGILRAMFRIPAVFAVVCWLAYAGFAGLHAAVAAQPVQVREVRAQCTFLPSDEITAPGRNWGTCQPGTGEVIMTTTNDLTRVANAMALGAAWFQRAATVFTVGAITVLVSSLLGHRGYRRWERPRPIAATVAHVQDGQQRARRDVGQAKARLGKAGEWRRKRIVKRWETQARDGEEFRDLGRVDRWVMRQTKPPKAKRSKTQRKADKAADQIEKATKRAAEVDKDFERHQTKVDHKAPHLDPTDGPPLSPRQRVEHAERVVDRAEADRDQVTAEVAAMYAWSDQ